MSDESEDNDVLRSLLFAEILSRREDEQQWNLIRGLNDELDYEPIDALLISDAAWKHVASIDVEPKFVFAHPVVLKKHPTTSLYYRGITLLSRKRVARLAKPVVSWEDGTRKLPIRPQDAIEVARLYNLFISSIIEGSTDWTLQNGHRNIIATMGITMDGSFRQEIGNVAEELVKSRIISELKSRKLISPDAPENGPFSLPDNIQMLFGSEPDIDFVKNKNSIATIEIKGGRDPAGALERLGAMSKSFAETPAGCTNFLIAGVVTAEMQKRINDMGVVKLYHLDNIANNSDSWDDFIKELFHHAIRII